MDYAYYNGIINEYDKARVPLSDRALFFGDGVYDVAIGRNGKIFQMEEHTERLLRNAERINVKSEGLKKEIFTSAESLIELFGSAPFTLYFQISRNSKRRKHEYDASALPNLLVTITEFSPDKNDAEVKLISLEDRRYKMCDIKTLNLLPNIIAANLAFSSECDECVFVKSGFVTECSHSNIFLLKDGKLYTHPDGSEILPGITKKNVFGICERLGFPVVESPFTYDGIFKCDELIISSTTRFIRRCVSVDGKSCGMRREDSFLRIKNALKSYYLTCTS